MKHSYFQHLLFAALLCTPFATSAQSDLTAEWIDTSAVRLQFSLTEAKHMGSRYAVTAIPTVSNHKGDSVALDMAIFRGKRNIRYTDRERFFDKTTETYYGEKALGDTVRYDVTLKRSDYPWIWDGYVYLDVRREKEGCCSVKNLTNRCKGEFAYYPIAPSVAVPEFRPEIQLVEEARGMAGTLEQKNSILCPYSQYKPYDNTKAISRNRNALLVHFPVNQYEINANYNGNAATLKKVIDITRKVKNDNRSSIKLIQIIGMASYDGPKLLNTLLAQARAESLKKYIQKRVDVSDVVFECNSAGEGWAELRAAIEESDIKERKQLLNIIDRNSDPDLREKKIRYLNNGKAYRSLKKHLLNKQRNSGYMRIYYEALPDKNAKVINEASTMIKEERYDDALQQLLTVKDDPRAFNALGVAYYMTGNATEGLQYLEKAARNGNAQAKENLNRLNEINNTENQ